MTWLLFHIWKMMSFIPTHTFFSPPFCPLSSSYPFHFLFHFGTHYLVNCLQERNLCWVYIIVVYMHILSKCERHKWWHMHQTWVEQVFCQLGCHVIQTNVKFCVINCHTLACYNPGKTRESQAPHQRHLWPFTLKPAFLLQSSSQNQPPAGFLTIPQHVKWYYASVVTKD